MPRLLGLLVAMSLTGACAAGGSDREGSTGPERSEPRPETTLEDRVEEHHRSYLPAGDGPFPTIVAVHGCSGVSLDGAATDEGRPGAEDDRLFRRHYPRMAERLREAGFAVILIDYLGAEGMRNGCGDAISGERVGEYVAAAVSFAQRQDYVDVEHLSIIGWSRGGIGLLEWFERLPTDATPIRSAVAFYPTCTSIEPWSTRIPLLLLLGGLDDIAPSEACQGVVDLMPPDHSVTVRHYENGRHGFDLDEGPSVLDVGGGFTVGRDPEAAEASWREVAVFLEQTLRPS